MSALPEIFADPIEENGVLYDVLLPEENAEHKNGESKSNPVDATISKSTASMAEWDESKHKRAKDGEFGSGGGKASPNEPGAKTGEKAKGAASPAATEYGQPGSEKYEKIEAFHSTTAEPFEKFDPKHIGESVGHKDPVEGFYFSNSDAHGSHIAEGQENEYRTMKVALDIRKPFRGEGYASLEQFGDDGETVRKNLIAKGYDGVILAGGDEIMAFYPEQIHIKDQGKKGA